MNVSIVIPLHNEIENIEALVTELKEFADEEPRVLEVILVDDGSRDGTYARAVELCDGDKRFRLLCFRRNFGQTAALSAGFDIARGEVICPMDGDLQNDPRDIPRLLEKVEEGYDVVSGWRKDRKDKLITRKIPSWIANKLISKITNVHLHDYGCSLKAYRKEILAGTRLYGEMHRFIPSLASWMGIDVAEIVVNHRPRVAGKTKYGLSRTFRVVLDLINVKFLTSYLTRPIQVFGKVAILSFGAGLLALAGAIYMKFGMGEDMTGNPLLLLSVMCVLVSFQFIGIGLLGEINIRTYYEIQQKPTYVIREKFQCDADAAEVSDKG
jgi:glycosyltransferase involved in cell wall biosynthesis